MLLDGLGSHFHEWIDYNGVTLSQKLLEWVSHFPDFGVKKIFLNLQCGNLKKCLNSLIFFDD